MVFDGCAQLVQRWNGYLPSSKSTLHAYVLNAAYIARYHQRESATAPPERDGVNSSSISVAQGNDCSLTMLRVDMCAHSVYRQLS